MPDGADPEGLRYHEAHVWVRPEGDVAAFGVTRHALEMLGDIVDYAPPELGSTVHAGDSCCELESIKAVSDVVAPLAGTVIEVNERVVDSPESVNADPYGSWLVRLRLDDPASVDALLDPPAYRALVG